MRTIFYLPSKLFVLSSLLCLANIAYSQDSNQDSHTITVNIPEVALLDIEPNASKDITATFTHSGEAGDPLTAPANNTSLWLNYSSILKTGGATARAITVAITSGTAPGVSIKVTAGTATGGQGTLGTPAAQVTLTGSAQSIITGVGSAYTGDGASQGHQLTYVFEAADANYANLRSNDGSPDVVTVTYTLADN